jgi:hypothetical protein
MFSAACFLNKLMATSLNLKYIYREPQQSQVGLPMTSINVLYGLGRWVTSLSIDSVRTRGLS